jgi:hypothetical protein
MLKRGSIKACDELREKIKSVLSEKASLRKALDVRVKNLIKY